MDYIRILSDNWDDIDKIFRVISYETYPNTTGAKFVLEHDNKTITRTICSHQVKWLDSDDI